MRIATVIVTFNRLSLLKECIESVKSQSFCSDKIFIVNNCSTDGTESYLHSIEDKAIECIHLDKNIGGAGGFSLGIKKAVQENFDYVWVMDDDSIPHTNALLNLSKAVSLDDNIGFAASKVVWTDGMPHKMNIPAFTKQNRDRTNLFNTFSREDIPTILIANATFVSILINSKAVRKVGLPIKEFFIWHDDIEFTERITNNGFWGLYVDNSIVTHKTNQNYFATPRTSSKEVAWKFYYQARNTTYIKRRKKIIGKFTFLLLFSTINKYRVFVHRLRKCPDKSAVRELKKQYRKGLWDGLSFNPQIEKIE